MTEFICFCIIIIVLFVGLIIFLSFLARKIEERRITKIGRSGEKLVSKYLAELPDEYTTINNAIFRTKRGTTQIDHIVVSKHGVFVIETKNYSGDIYGDDDSKKWKQNIVTPVTYIKNPWKTYTYVTQNTFYNPVKQSLGHMFAVREILNDFPKLPIIPMVVFVDSVNLSNVYSKYPVIFAGELKDTILQYQSIYLMDGGLNKVLSILQEKNVSDVVTVKDHVKNINKAYKDTRNKINEGICPWCGGQLIKRTGSYGPFYGCSNYPKCKYILKTNRRS